MLSLRNVALLGLGTLLAALFGFWLWSSNPPVRDPQYYQDTLDSAQARLERFQLIGADPERNAFSQPDIAKLLGREEVDESISHLDLSEVLDKWNRHYSDYLGKRADYQEVLVSADPEVVKARQDFLAMLPGLKKGLQRPHLVLPITGFDADTKLGGVLACRDIALALTGYCELLAAQERYSEVKDELELVFHMAHALEGQGHLLFEMVACAERSVGFGAAVRLLPPDAPLSPEEWRAFGDSLLSELPSPEQFYQVLEMEVLALHQSNIGGYPNPQPPGTMESIIKLLLPGLAEREERISVNNQVELLKSVKYGTFKQFVASRSDPTLMDLLTGRSGTLSVIFVVSYARVPDLMNSSRKLTLGLAVSYHALAFAKSSGRYPQSLEELQIKGLPADWRELEMQLITEEDGGCRLVLPLSVGEFEIVPDEEELQAPNGWVGKGGDRFEFRLPPNTEKESSVHKKTEQGAQTLRSLQSR